MAPDSLSNFSFSFLNWIKNKMIFTVSLDICYRLSDATFYDHINTIYQFIKPFLNKKCLFLRNREPLTDTTYHRILIYSSWLVSVASVGLHVVVNRVWLQIKGSWIQTPAWPHNFSGSKSDWRSRGHEFELQLATWLQWRLTVKEFLQPFSTILNFPQLSGTDESMCTSTG